MLPRLADVATVTVTARERERETGGRWAGEGGPHVTGSPRQPIGVTHQNTEEEEGGEVDGWGREGRGGEGGGDVTDTHRQWMSGAGSSLGQDARQLLQTQ